MSSRLIHHLATKCPGGQQPRTPDTPTRATENGAAITRLLHPERVISPILTSLRSSPMPTYNNRIHRLSI